MSFVKASLSAYNFYIEKRKLDVLLKIAFQKIKLENGKIIISFT